MAKYLSLWCAALRHTCPDIGKGYVSTSVLCTMYSYVQILLLLEGIPGGNLSQVLVYGLDISFYQISSCWYQKSNK